MRITFSFLAMLCLIFHSACGSNTTDGSVALQKDETDNTATLLDQSGPEQTGSEPFAADELLYSWVDNLNIRDAPSMDGKVVSKVNDKTALRFTGERSETNETIVLRGVAYEAPWLKISTPEGTEGWVFGGAVKHEDELKGNGPITDQVFNFPVFGNYNLAEWQKISEEKGGEEVDYITTHYRKGGQLLTVTQSGMGEFHYGCTYQLMDKDSALLKERVFSFTAQEKPFTLEEKVVDYTSNPPVVYRRTQSLDLHFYDLNERPMMVDAPWEKETL